MNPSPRPSTLDALESVSRRLLSLARTVDDHHRDAAESSLRVVAVAGPSSGAFSGGFAGGSSEGTAFVGEADARGVASFTAAPPTAADLPAFDFAAFDESRSTPDDVRFEEIHSDTEKEPPFSREDGRIEVG
ncbi:MAG: hypothetical protein ACRDD1_04990, partial [Planctomycetia bacterium]